MHEFLCLAIILECLIFNFLNSILYGKRLNITKAQNYVWMFTFLIYLANIFQYYEMRVEVYIYSLTYLLMFNIVYLVFHKKSDLDDRILALKLVASIDDLKKNISILKILSIICWLVTIPLLIKSIPILMNSGMSTLRHIVYSENSIYTTFDMMLIQYLARPLYSITIILSATMLAVKKYNKPFFIITLINAIMYSLLTSGRALFMQMVLFVGLSIWFFHGNNISKLFKTYRKIIIPITIVLVGILWVSSLRVNRSYGVIGEFFIYMTGSIPYLSLLIESGKVEFYSLFGKAYFGFVLDSIRLILRFIGFNVVLSSQTVSELTLDSLYVSPTIAINAIASTLLDFLLEAGFIGVILGGIISGIIAVSAENYYYKRMTIFSFILFLFIMQIMFFSIQLYGLGKVNTFISLLLMIVFIYKPQKKNKMSQ